MPPQDAAHEDRPHAHGGELFPRKAIADLVGEAERQRLTRQRVQGWVLGAGLAALALGLPLERFAGTTLVEWTVGDRPGVFPLLAPLVRGLATLTGAPPERAWYFVAAALYGLSLPALLGLLRGIGFEHRTSLFASLVALAAPLAWRGAVSPRADSAALLAAILLARVLFTGQKLSRAGYGARAAGAWFVLAALHPELLLLAPVVGWAAATHGSESENRQPDLRAAVPVLVAAAGLLGLLRLTTGVELSLLPMLLIGVPEAASISDGPLPLGPTLELLTPLLAHGVSLFGILMLFSAQRQPEEQPPPLWLKGWTLACALPLILVSFGEDPVVLGAGLAPIAAIGLADWIGRKGREEAALLRALPLLGMQVLATAGIMVQIAATDPDAAWREPARIELRPDDLVLAEERAEVHVMRYRWGLDVVDLARITGEERRLALPPILARASAEGRRVVLALDPDEQERVRALDPALEMIDLPRTHR